MPETNDPQTFDSPPEPAEEAQRDDASVRLFIGIRPDSRTQAFCDALVRSIEPGLGKRPVRWTSATNRHLTLAFLGETAKSLIPPLEQGIATIAGQHAPCWGRIVSLAPFPKPRSRLLAAELLTNPELDRLHDSCRQLMIDLGLTPEGARYRPHFTLGRNRSGFGGVRPYPLDQVVALDNLVLYESLLAPGGSQYAPIFECALSGPADAEAID